MADYQQNFLGALRGGLDFGQQVKRQRDQSALGQLASQAYGAAPEQRTSLLGQMASISPQAAQAQQNAWDGDEDRRNKSMVNMARLLTSAPEEARPGLWRSFVPTLSQYGLSELPPEYNEQTAPIITKAAAALSQAYGGDQTQQRNLVVGPGGAIVNPQTGQELYARPFAPQNQSFEFSGLDGKPRRYTFNARTGDYEEASLSGGDQSLPLTSPVGEPQEVYAALADRHGFQTTSATRTPRENSKVGGVPNSQHLSGTARDFSVRGKTPDQINAFVKDLRAQGFEVITRDHGTGPHIHAELPPPSGGGQPLVGRSKEEEAGAVEAAKIQAQLNAAPQVSAADAQAAELKTEAEERAKSGAERAKKIPQYQNVERGLTRIDNALRALQGKFVDTGPLDQYAVMMTNEGQELAAAVGAIQNDMLALTRVPGVGSQSDLEQRIANLKYPDLRYHPSVNQANLQQLRSFVNDLGESLGSGSQKAGAVRRARNPQTGEVLILVNGQWVPENGR